MILRFKQIIIIVLYEVAKNILNKVVFVTSFINIIPK